MIALLQKQYELVKSSREVVFNFIENKVGDDLNKPVEAFEGKTARYLLVHTANTYLHWLAFFALNRPVEFKEDPAFTSVELIRPLYEQADEAVAFFLHHFADKIEFPLTAITYSKRTVTTTPLQLFTHVVTHEFHHKGQVMTMCRLLGHTPPDTDVIRS